MNDTWHQLSIIKKVILAVGFIVMSSFTVVLVVVGHWSAAVRSGLMVVVLAWSFGLMEALRMRTTERLSKAQTLALALPVLVAYWGWRFVATDDGSVYLGVGIVGLVIWIVRTVVSEGWSRPAD